MKIKFAISSHNLFWKTTYPIVVNSLIESSVPAEDIYFFVGGCHETKKIEGYSVNLYHVDHNSIDFTALISVLELGLKSDYWFLLHDTCSVGANFFKAVKEFKYDESDAVKLCPKLSMNIGAYKQLYLESIYSDIMELKNKDHSEEAVQHYKKLAVLKEDFIFDRSEKVLVYNTTPRFYEGPFDYYKNGIPRVISYFSDLDLFKMQANWTTKEKYELNL